MNKARRILLVAAVVALTAVSTFAVNVAGTWTGKVVIDKKTVPKGKTPEEQQQIDAGMNMAGQMKMVLTMKSNKTWSGVLSFPGTTNKETAEGTWSLAGNVVTLKTTKNNGKPATGDEAKPQKLKLSKDGKTMSMDIPAGQGIKSQFVFKR